MDADAGADAVAGEDGILFIICHLKRNFSDDEI